MGSAWSPAFSCFTSRRAVSFGVLANLVFSIFNAPSEFLTGNLSNQADPPTLSRGNGGRLIPRALLLHKSQGGVAHSRVFAHLFRTFSFFCDPEIFGDERNFAAGRKNALPAKFALVPKNSKRREMDDEWRNRRQGEESDREQEEDLMTLTEEGHVLANESHRSPTKRVRVDSDTESDQREQTSPSAQFKCKNCHLLAIRPHVCGCCKSHLYCGFCAAASEMKTEPVPFVGLLIDQLCANEMKLYKDKTDLEHRVERGIHGDVNGIFFSKGATDADRRMIENVAAHTFEDFCSRVANTLHLQPFCIYECELTPHGLLVLENLPRAIIISSPKRKHFVGIIPQVVEPNLLLGASLSD